MTDDEDTLLPSSASTFDRQLASMGDRLKALPTELHHLWDPYRTPSDFLPFLAWAVSVDDWNTEWTESQKREVVANSKSIHERKGTIGAIEQAIQNLGYTIDIIELQRTLGQSYHHQIDANVNVGNLGITAELQDEVSRIIESNKRKSVHLRQLQLRAESLVAEMYLATTVSTAVFTTLNLDTTG